MHEHGVGDTLAMTSSRLCSELRCTWPVLLRYLNYSQTMGKLSYRYSSGEVVLEIKNFRKRLSNLKIKIPSTSSQLPPNFPIEREREREEHNNIRQGELAKVEAPARKPTQFNAFMDRFLKGYLGLHPGDPDPAKRKAVEMAYKRFGKAGSEIMAYAEGDPELAYQGLNSVGKYMNAKGLSWTLDTVAKRFLEWKLNPEDFNERSRT